jgi:hypothetical protein
MNGQDVKPLFEDPSASVELRNFVALARSDGPSDAELNRLAARLGPVVGLSAGVMLTSAAASGGALGTAPAALVSMLQPGAAKLGLFGKLLASGSSKLLAVGLSAGIGVGLWAWMESSQPSPKAGSARSAAPQLATPESEPALAGAGGGAASRAAGTPGEELPPRTEAAPLQDHAPRAAAPPEPAVVAAPPDPSGSGQTRSRRAAGARTSTAVKKKGPSDPPATPTAERPSELSLIQQAEAARGQGAEALALLATHERLYPRGALAQEREVLAIELLLKAGKVEQARARAERFVSSHPSSAHLPRVRALVARTANE